jgi:hypothetical protein
MFFNDDILPFKILDKKLPNNISPSQIRGALTAVKQKIFIDSTFNKDGWLTLGLVGGQQQELADSYSNTG